MSHVLAEHKPLTFALTSANDNHTPREIRHMTFISEFIRNRHVKKVRQHVADAHSRIVMASRFLLTPAAEYQALALEHAEDEELKTFRAHSSHLSFEEIHPTPGDEAVTCEMSTGSPRPFLPPNFRKQILSLSMACHIHGFA